MPTGSHRIYELWRESAEKFDYFMAGLPAALVAYLAPTLQPTRVGWSADTLELVALLALVGSVFAGFKRIEATVHATRVGGDKLYERDAVAAMSNAAVSGTPVTGKDSGRTLSHQEVTTLIEARKERAGIAEGIERGIVTRASRWYATRNLLLFS